MVDSSSCGVDFLLIICLLFVLGIVWKNSARPFHIQGGSRDGSSSDVSSCCNLEEPGLEESLVILVMLESPITLAGEGEKKG